jgi:hypothetical protein
MVRRAIPAAIVLCLLGGLVWAVSDRDRVGERAARLATGFDRSKDEVERWRAALRTTARLMETELGAQRRETRRWRNRYEEVGWELRAARRRLRELADLADVLVPGPASVQAAEVVRSTGETRLLVSSWSRERPWGGTLRIWRLTPRPPGATKWRRVYEVVADYDSLSIRTPTTLSRERSDVGYAGAGLVAAHDLTGDGLRDLVIHATGTGTGGRGTVWVLENGDPLREIFERLDCENFVDAEGGLLVYDDARQPKGCEHIHGCGRRKTWLRWDGASWETVRTRRYS